MYSIIRWNYEEWGAVVTNISLTKIKCTLRFKTAYSEPILNGTDPVLKESLIPIVIENDGTVKKAVLSEEWYSYEKKNWANAVILKDENIIYNENEVIPESNIESYFVWVPRYRYKIFNNASYTSLTATVTDNQVASAAKEIEIVFENKDIAKSSGATIGTWLTHPAFTSFNNNGMWVGKFETSKGNSEPNNSINPDGVEIKANQTSWGLIQIANAFYTSYNYKRNLNSHMMKNTEWGAVAYLSHSKYGSKESIRINNNSDYKTGYAAKNEPTCGNSNTNLTCNISCNDGSCNEPYNTSVGYLASTTGNISGIYDMSGGAWEFVMGVMADQNGNLVSGSCNTSNSGFIGNLTRPSEGSDTSKESWTAEDGGLPFPDTRYYDIYSYRAVYTDFSGNILGDATGEMGPFGKTLTDSITGTSSGSGVKVAKNISSWYSDVAHSLNPSGPWYVRGGRAHSYGTHSGIFSFFGISSGIRSDWSFRVVLTD